MCGRDKGHQNDTPADSPRANADTSDFFTVLDDLERLENDARRLLQEIDARPAPRTFIMGETIKRRPASAPALPVIKGTRRGRRLPSPDAQSPAKGLTDRDYSWFRFATDTDAKQKVPEVRSDADAAGISQGSGGPLRSLPTHVAFGGLNPSEGTSIMRKGPALDLVAIAWYSRDDFYRIRQFEPDGGGLQETFEEWLKGAQQGLLNIANLGLRVERIDVDPDALFAYCRRSKVKCDEKARSAFVFEIVSARESTKH